MAAKRPTGELPKRNSKLAQFIASAKSNKMTPAQARAAAGKFRDMEKAAGGYKGIGAMDASGAALGKAVKQTQKMSKSTKKTVEKSAVTNKPQPASSGKKIKIIAGSASTSGGPKPKTSVSGSSIAGGMKVNTGAKATPKPTAKATPKPKKMTPEDAAMKKILEKKYGKIYG